MRIGLDFDNTLARYDHVFASEAKQERLVPKDWEGTKKQLRDNLRSLQGGELLWQKLQGRVYGICMSQATMFPGVSQFLMRCKKRGHTVFIVSHKTEFGHYDSTKTSLRMAALDWMKSNGFFKKERFGLSKDHVFFEKTCKEKVKRISSLDLDVFVDDLEKVFLEDDFPDINKILFGKTSEGSNYSILCENWNDITNEVLGPITNEECKELAQSILDENVSEVRKLEGRGNSRIYRVVTQSTQIYALKNYPDLLIDSRKRLQTEVQSFRFLEDFHLTPKVVAFDVDLNMALYEWIEGKPLTIIENEHVDQALNFVEKLHGLDPPDYIQPASEACTSRVELVSQIERRLKQLENLKNKNLQQFLETVFKPLYQDVRMWSEEQWPADNLLDELPISRQTLSPSDFGFHNSILRRDGTLCFLDFEYFGWDDPVKLIADFIWHPAMNMNDTQKKRWLQKCFNIFGDSQQIEERFHAAWPLYGLRWVMILLNEFRKEGWKKRVYVNEKLERLRKKNLKEQIKKASTICRLISSHQMDCLYV